MTNQNKGPTGRGWKFWVDVGGTFTDGFCRSPAGHESTSKVLSTSTWKRPACDNVDSLRQGYWQDPGLSGSGSDFWRGYLFRGIDSNGRVVCQSPVVRYDDESGKLYFAATSSWAEAAPPDAGNLDSTSDLAKSATPRLSQNLLASYELVSPEPAPIFLIRRVLRVALDHPLDGIDLSLGTTRGTNALLTRTGAKVGLLVTQGLRDLLLIGEQQRPQLFDLEITKSQPLYADVWEVPERVLDDGTIDHPLDGPAVKAQLARWRDAGIESLAICLFHGYRHPEHERQIAALAAPLGFRNVSCSHQVAPVIKLVARCETTVLDAYLNLAVRDYARQIEQCLGHGSRLQFMTSSGGLVSPTQFTGKDSVLSGPAGGVVGFAEAARQTGFDRAIGFDMGGTSTDVARFDGSFDKEFETRKAGVRILTPVMAIETVAAGGGSICGFDGQRLTVGPQSATANPGPACYGRGGPLAITDLNFFLGRIAADQFPFPLNRQAVLERLNALRQDILNATGRDYTDVELAQGFLEIANEQMALALQTVSVAKGFDPREYVLVAFGGAGPQHAIAVAERLQMRRILVPAPASILSAYGISCAKQQSYAVRSILKPVTEELVEQLAHIQNQLTGEVDASLQTWLGPSEQIAYQWSVDLRFVGTEPTLNVAWSTWTQTQAEFCRQHQQFYGYLPTQSIELVNLRLEGTIVAKESANGAGEIRQTKVGSNQSEIDQPPVSQQADMYGNGKWQRVPVIDWHLCQTGKSITGPALISDRLTTVAVHENWSATLTADRGWLLEPQSTAPAAASKVTWSEAVTMESGQATDCDPILLEVFNHQFISIAKQMGVTLARTAISVNIKDRLDFSCAIFTESGDLVVNAPHIPVHLGAMSETVRNLIRLNPDVAPGDVFVTNDPFQGGSHLPDITVVTPVFLDGTSSVQFWVANRGHHAEIGGRTPGSMPPDATRLLEEGVLIQNFRLLRRGQMRFDELQQLLSAGPWPTRNVADNLADIRAQIAANQTGAQGLLNLTQRYSVSLVNQYMDGLLDLAESQMQMALAELPAGTHRFSDRMDNGAEIHVALERVQSKLRVDFTGTSPVTPDNLNANRAICLAAIMYCLRCLMKSQVPLNEGIIRPVELILPECFLNPPVTSSLADRPAVVGGNVETSQRIVDVFLAALGRAAASQGTMNNWLMGDETFGYYETVGGGSGGTPWAVGADAVHTHMTNTRLTDPEILEHRYPCVLRELAIRRGSGGSGWHAGGCGMIREVEFRRNLTVSLLTSRRCVAPFGLEGGASGSPGKNLLWRTATASWQELPSRIGLQVASGDRLRLETPGGGGWGKAR